MDWSCVTPGMMCSLLDLCGNGALNVSETCDDSNRADGDGCDRRCRLEAGWRCLSVGAACDAARCGDGIIAGAEDCDDGNATAGDGCASDCVTEDDYACATPGMPCTVRDLCGNRALNVGEVGFDGNRSSLDGCSTDCRSVSAGWVCSVPGTACRAARCSERVVAGT